jgi:cereblon
MSHVVSVTQEGPGGTFVNEHGYVHDMICIGQIDSSSVMTQGSPETANSWFPGYAWTCMSCRVCSQHLGWLFTKATESVQPAYFWGLRRSAVQHGHAQSPASSELELDLLAE